jgi:hypothetical protein
MITNKTAFERERPVFNDQSLAKMLPDVKMAWHLHHIFERTIRHDPNNRYTSTAKALTEARKVRRLIVECFKPLEELASGICPVCGIGEFTKPVQTPYIEAVRSFFKPLPEASHLCWVCPYCFHLTFTADKAQGLLLEDRKKLE